MKEGMIFKLEVLDNCYRGNRQVGHTLAMLSGAKSNKNILVIMANESQKSYIDLPKERFIDMHNLQEKLLGRKNPVLVDYFTIQLMYWEMKKELDEKKNKIIELEVRNKILQNRVKAKLT